MTKKDKATKNPKAKAKAKSSSKAPSGSSKPKSRVRKTAVKSKARPKAKSGEKSKKGKKDKKQEKKPVKPAPTDVGPHGFDEEGEEEPHELNQELQVEVESAEVTRKRKAPIAPPPADAIPVKKASKPTDDVAAMPVIPKAPAAVPAPEVEIAPTPVQASLPPVVTADGDTQDGTLWFLGSILSMHIYIYTYVYIYIYTYVYIYT